MHPSLTFPSSERLPVADYLPHTDTDLREMLAFLGLESLDELFAHIPEALRLTHALATPEGLSEPDVAARFQDLAALNQARSSRTVCFAGAGAYDHPVPPVVTSLGSRSEFVTAYTPYQPEVAQGVLQAVFEYQSMVSRLFGLEVANASLYDGATGLVEALNMAHGSTGRSRMVISQGVHPHWRQVVKTFARGTGYEIVEVPLVNGVTDWSGVDLGEAAAVVVAYPNVLGAIEEVGAPMNLAHAHGALGVVCANPVALGVLRSPGDFGADVVVGEGQPFGTALSFGGPYLGLFACTMEQIRRLPGRIVGETLDLEGRRAFVTTLRAREQDIRREKATSNICSNQTLMAITASIQLSYLGPRGLYEVAARSAAGAHHLAARLSEIPGVSLVSDAPFLHEFALRLPVSAHRVVHEMAAEGLLAGVALDHLSEGESCGVRDPETVLLVAVTEKRTREEMDSYVDVMKKVVA